MKKNKLSAFLIGLGGLLSVALIVLLISLNQRGDNDVIYFVSKTSSENSTFWHSVERGVKVAADEIGANIVFVGPERELDLDDQIDLVRDGIDEDPMAIILAASDYNALAEVAKEVMDKKIPFLTVDSDVNVENAHSFIATDNVAAANMLAKELAKYMGEEGTVGIISHLEGATSAIDRENGFIEGMGAFSEIEVLDKIFYSSNDSDIAYEKAVEMMKLHPEITGLFATNEATLIGIAKAIEDLDLGERVNIVGFDISEEAASYIEKDIVKAIIVQRPFNMGYLSVYEANRLANGGNGTDFIDVDVVLVSKKNMFDEENQKFIIPFLE